jgi:enterochelin esterase-like enzyme
VKGHWVKLTIGVTALTLTAVGLMGAYRYGLTFWLYRGFSPPSVSARVAHGRLVRLSVPGPVPGTKADLVYVFLPPGYSRHAADGYPSLYLLHGVPGAALNFIQVGDIGVGEDVLVAQHKMRPMVLVMPQGPSGFFDDSEWADGVRPGSDWETWVADDVVRAIDRRFRVSTSPSARGIAGMSEGGYGALNIGIHHPDEFHLIESWSGYMKAVDIRSIFGRRTSMLRDNSPALTVRANARQMADNGDYIWFYCGSRDEYSLAQNRNFAAELTELHLPHTFTVVQGATHNWALWRSMADRALLAASAHLATTSPGSAP